MNDDSLIGISTGKRRGLTQHIFTYDCTLRDGEQCEGISLSLDDKLRIVERLDAFGIDFIEGGFPASNPKDIEFFRRVKEMPLVHTKNSDCEGSSLERN